MGKEVFNTALSLTMVRETKTNGLLPTMFPGWNTKAFPLRTVLFFPQLQSANAVDWSRNLHDGKKLEQVDFDTVELFLA